MPPYFCEFSTAAEGRGQHLRTNGIQNQITQKSQQPVAMVEVKEIGKLYGLNRLAMPPIFRMGIQTTPSTVKIRI